MISRKFKKIKKEEDRRIRERTGNAIKGKMVNVKLEYYLDLTQKEDFTYCQVKNFDNNVIHEFLLDMDLKKQIKDLNIKLEYKKELQNKIKLL